MTTAGPYVHEATKQELGEQYLGGAEVAEVAEGAALDVDTVCETLADMGITLRTDDRPPVDPAEVLAAYARGASIREIAKNHGRAYTTIHRILYDGGATFRPRGAQARPARAPAARTP